MTARVRKAPSGKRHIACLSHAPHAYPSTGYVCVTTNDPDRAADMLAFADHLAAVAARHTARGSYRPIVDAIESRPYASRPYIDGAPAVDTDDDDAPYAYTRFVGPMLGECDWRYYPAASQLPIPSDHGEPAADTRPVAAIYTPDYMRAGAPHLPWDSVADREARARLVDIHNARRGEHRAPVRPSAPIAPIVYPAPAEGSAESLAAAFRGFASDMLTAGRELGILAPAEPIYAEPAPIVAPEPAAETAEDVAEPAADPGADTAEPYDSDASTREWWRGREHRGRAVDGTAQWADGADDVYGAGTYGVAQCDACGDPIASTPAYDAWSHAADDVAEAMRQLGMMGADTADTPETAEDVAEPDGAPIVAPVGDAPAYGTQHVGVRHNGRADWRTYDRETGADIGPMHATRTAAVAYAQERQLTTYGPAPEPIADTPEPVAEPVRHLQYANRSGFTYCAQVPTARDISAPDHLGALSVLTAVGGFCEMCIEYCARSLAPEPGADPDGAERCAYDGCATPDSLDTHHGGNGGPAHMRVTAAELASWAAEDVAEPAEPIAEPVADPAPVAPILAAVPAPAEPAPVDVDGRPTCPRCGQTFRKSGTGRDWHVANRPDCADGRPAVLSVAS